MAADPGAAIGCAVSSAEAVPTRVPSGGERGARTFRHDQFPCPRPRPQPRRSVTLPTLAYRPRAPKFKPPFGVAGVSAEQDTLDRLDLWRKMLVVQPVADCPIAQSDGSGELLHAPLSSWVINSAARPRSAAQMPT